MSDECLYFLLQDTNVPMQIIINKIRESESHEINRERTVYGEYHHLFPLLRKYEHRFEQYMRMKISTFDYILHNVQKSLEKNWCNLHKRPILPEERLVLTIRFLATGMSYTDLAFSFRMGVSTVSEIVKETMKVLWEKLYPIHMPIPSKQTFIKIAEDFYSKWNFPHCLGAIDGRHVRIKCPAKSGSLYYNYKKFYSIVLQAVVDANYKFVTIDVGGYGKQSDGGTFQASTLYKAMKQVLQIPEDSNLPGSTILLPFYFIGDGAYPLMENLMKPYPGTNLPKEKETFNKRLSRARMVVERAFGMTCQKWRVFYSVIQQPPEVINFIIKSTCILHNIIIDLQCNDSQQSSSPSMTSMSSGLVGDERVNDFIVGYGKEVRKELTKYFMANN